MIFDREKLQNHLEELTPHQQAFFALLCAERLQTCCWAFSKQENWDLSKYYEGCELLFQHLVYATTIESSRMITLLQDIDECVPQADEFGDPLSMQAQSGLIALLYAFDAWKMADEQAAVNAAEAVDEGLDNYDYFLYKTLTGERTSSDENPLLDREIQWQFESIEILKQLTQAELAEFVSLRLRNRYYAVPIAV